MKRAGEDLQFIVNEVVKRHVGGVRTTRRVRGEGKQDNVDR